MWRVRVSRREGLVTYRGERLAASRWQKNIGEIEIFIREVHGGLQGRSGTNLTCKGTDRHGKARHVWMFGSMAMLIHAGCDARCKFEACSWKIMGLGHWDLIVSRVWVSRGREPSYLNQPHVIE